MLLAIGPAKSPRGVTHDGVAIKLGKLAQVTTSQVTMAAKFVATVRVSNPELFN